MIDSITIKNFRCFQKLEIHGLSSVNLFSGKNNVGKTSLLEAIFLSLGSYNPGLPFLIDSFRGVTQVEPKAEEMWGWLFNKHDTNSEIQIDCNYADGNSSVFRICLSRSEESKLHQLEIAPGGVDPSNGGASTLMAPSELVMSYTLAGQEPRIAKARIEGGEVKQLAAEKTGVDAIFLSSKAIQAGENADRFSKLKQKGDEVKVLESLKLIEPRLRELTILVQGGKPVVAGDIGLGQFIPISYMGEGINKLLTTVLAIASAPGGAVLIDEIENGFHHSVLPDLWRVIIDTSERFDTQLFISTHSYECMQAAFDVSSELPNHPCAFQRLQRDDDRIFSVPLAAESLSDAFESNLEIR